MFSLCSKRTGKFDTVLENAIRVPSSRIPDTKQSKTKNFLFFQCKVGNCPFSCFHETSGDVPYKAYTERCF